MTTDITELALLVSKAKASVFTLEYISQFEPADIDSDDVDLRFEVDGRDTGTNVSIVDECGQAAKVIGTLVEALEKAQQRIAVLDAELEREREKSRRVMSRITELEEPKEKRLPEPYAYLRENDGQIQISIGAERPSDRSGGYATPWFAIYTVAGIKVEAE